LGFQLFNRIGVLRFRESTLLVGDLPGTRGTRVEGVELPAVEVSVDFQKLLAAHGQVFSVTAAEPDPPPILRRVSAITESCHSMEAQCP